jgi:protein SCO1/2
MVEIAKVGGITQTRKKQIPILCALMLVNLALYSPLFAHGTGVDSASSTMGVDEKLGSMVPLDVPFTTETNDTVQLKTLVKGPTILSLLYYRCPNACNLLLVSIANVLRPYADKPETAPNVISISVDDRETPADAMKAREIAFAAIEKPYPADRWHFLTGSAESVDKVADAVGFHFVKKGEDFDHPLCIIILSPRGKVVRYILGTDYLPVDLAMSLMEASSGAVQPTIARVLRSCFSIDPKSHRLVFNLMRVSATVILTLLAIFITYLVVSGRKRMTKGKHR